MSVMPLRLDIIPRHFSPAVHSRPGSNTEKNEWLLVTRRKQGREERRKRERRKREGGGGGGDEGEGRKEILAEPTRRKSTQDGL